MTNERFYFVQLPWGPWTIAKYFTDRDAWKLADGYDGWTLTSYFKAVGDMIPVPEDGNHASVVW